MKNKNLNVFIRIFWKLIFSWAIVSYIFFLQPLKVNFPENINRTFQSDSIFKDKWIKKYKKTKKVSIKTIEKKITEKEKYKFLLDIVKQAFSKVHWAWVNEKSFDKLCSYYKDYCDIIDIDEEKFSIQEKTYYIWITIYLSFFVNNIFHDLKKKIYYIKIQKSKSWRRWYAGHHSIVINVKNDMSYLEFYEVLTHEFWHIVDLWLLNWKSLVKSIKFKEFWKPVFSIDDTSLKFYKLCFLSSKVKKSEIYTKDFVSWYAMTNVFEDFAETFNMFVNHNYVFKKMAKESNILQKKYYFFNKLLHWKYLKSDKYFSYKYGFRPWDSTRMK